MMTLTAIINNISYVVILALTPVERWDAAGKFSSNFTAERWLILIGVIAIAILTVLLFAISFNRIKQEQKIADQLFGEYAEKRGLSEREQKILLDVVSRARLKRNDSIFTLVAAFDRGAAKMKRSLMQQQTIEENSHLRAELSLLREKLGFREEPAVSLGQSTKSKNLNSRQIPIGRKIYMTQQQGKYSDKIVSTVIRNTDLELAVRLTKPVKITFGQLWCVRYYFRASVWEFDTSVVSYDGDILVLNHSDNVRFVNRRRFLRVPVRKPTFIAHFPFSTMSGQSGNTSQEQSKLTEGSDGMWGPPEFVPAVVTELAGPGLRIETSLDVKLGQRVLVVFCLDKQKTQNLDAANAGALKIVEDIGQVKHTKAMPNGLSIAVELTGLSDSDIDELICATNIVSVRAEDGNALDSTELEQYIGQTKAAKGV